MDFRRLRETSIDRDRTVAGSIHFFYSSNPGGCVPLNPLPISKSIPENAHGLFKVYTKGRENTRILFCGLQKSCTVLFFKDCVRFQIVKETPSTNGKKNA